ncbi:hypothetical protein D3C87_2103120 [compost metagenome]
MAMRLEREMFPIWIGSKRLVMKISRRPTEWEEGAGRSNLVLQSILFKAARKALMVSSLRR